jgi:hypothetical protein
LATATWAAPHWFCIKLLRDTVFWSVRDAFGTILWRNPSNPTHRILERSVGRGVVAAGGPGDPQGHGRERPAREPLTFRNYFSRGRLYFFCVGLTNLKRFISLTDYSKSLKKNFTSKRKKRGFSFNHDC